MAQYTYYRGSQSSREAVTYDITRRGQYITTCVVDVQLLLCGIKAFPCGNGDDVKFTAQQRLEILETVQAERKRITDRYPVKTYEGWQESGLPSFEDYCFPGDMVDGELVTHFVNDLPPALMRATCTQAGGEFSCEGDEHGGYKPTYITFHRIDADGGLWRFDGYCFYGQNENRYTRKSRLEELIDEARREVEGNA